MTTYTIARDLNGNKVCKVKPAGSRAFSIQTSGNLPLTHSNGVTEETPFEVAAYVRAYGTNRQKEALCLS